MGESINAAPCYLTAISMSRDRRPVRLFITNRGVTAKAWYRVDDVVALVTRFVIDLAKPLWLLDR